jgi:hypothetical protein
MSSKRRVLVILAIIGIVSAISLLVWRTLFPSATPPPTIHYVGTTADKSQLLFEIRNPSSSAWNFTGYSPTMPSYEFRTAGRSEWSSCNTSQLPAGSKFDRYVVPAQSVARFAVPRPSQSKQIEVHLRLFPGANSRQEQHVEYYSNKLLMFFGKQPTNHAVVQRSGIVNLSL